jgi:hypothetical protein
MRYIKLWDGITIDWRYSKSPYHMHLFIHCLLEAWHADAKEFKRGTFRTSYRKLENQTGISRKKIIELLKNLSTGDNPEIIVETKKGYEVGYTQITILNYDKYQSNVSDSTSKVYHSTSKVSESTTKVSHSASNVSLGHPKEEEEKKEEKEEKKQERVLTSLSTDVGSSFEDLIQLYPKKYTHKAETINLFNNLDLDEKKKCVSFAKQLQQIWEQNGDKEKYTFMKSCHTFVEQKLFNGKPSEVLPAGISTEIKELKYAHEDAELMKKLEEMKLKRLNKRKQYEETNEHQ